MSHRRLQSIEKHAWADLCINDYSRSYVSELTPDNIDTFISKASKAVILFGKASGEIDNKVGRDWAGNLVYMKIKSKLAWAIDYMLGIVDCENYPDLCYKYGAWDSPTMIQYHSGKPLQAFGNYGIYYDFVNVMREREPQPEENNDAKHSLRQLFEESGMSKNLITEITSQNKIEFITQGTKKGEPITIFYATANKNIGSGWYWASRFLKNIQAQKDNGLLDGPVGFVDCIDESKMCQASGYNQYTTPIINVRASADDNHTYKGNEGMIEYLNEFDTQPTEKVENPDLRDNLVGFHQLTRNTYTESLKSGKQQVFFGSSNEGSSKFWAGDIGVRVEELIDEGKFTGFTQDNLKFFDCELDMWFCYQSQNKIQELPSLIFIDNGERQDIISGNVNLQKWMDDHPSKASESAQPKKKNAWYFSVIDNSSFNQIKSITDTEFEKIKNGSKRTAVLFGSAKSKDGVQAGKGFCNRVGIAYAKREEKPFINKYTFKTLDCDDYP